jgi:hypothetical protein
MFLADVIYLNSKHLHIRTRRGIVLHHDEQGVILSFCLFQVGEVYRCIEETVEGFGIVDSTKVVGDVDSGQSIQVEPSYNTCRVSDQPAFV